jgi:hypothetical protein
LPINPADRQENLHCEGQPEDRNNPPGEFASGQTVQANGCQNNQDGCDIGEAMDVQRVDEVIDVRDVAPDIQDLEHQRKEGNAAKHHVGEIADQRFDEEL